MGRIESHPILEIPKRRIITFTFNGRPVQAMEGEPISSALIAAGVHVFGHHHRDGAAQGIFCFNGQCAQCLVLIDGVPVKGCMTLAEHGMTVTSCEGRPPLPQEDGPPESDYVDSGRIETIETACLIIGGGPAGLAAAIELGKAGVDVILIDDKYALGGKLTLQTHQFFGSTAECYAGTRGIEIARILTNELDRCRTVRVWPGSTAVGIFWDGKVGVVKQGKYVLVKPETLLVASGSREKTLAFPGCDLPGIYGAGAFQTLLNRDLVKPAERLFICGGGNVGLITAYHAMQAGIQITGLAEAAESCGGYRVHLDKICNLGVPVFTSHTILKAEGTDRIEDVSIARVNENFQPVPGTECTFSVDALLIAVGLSPVDELYIKAREYGLSVRAAGDSEEISEASAAMFSGTIAGRKIIRELRDTGSNAAAEDSRLLTALRSKPGPPGRTRIRRIDGKVYPVIRCTQEIPCDPCVEACGKGSIRLIGDPLLGIPEFIGEECSGCGRCVMACPGLAVVLVDESYDPTGKRALVTVPFEFSITLVQPGDEVVTVGGAGETVGRGKVVEVRPGGRTKRTLLLLEVPFGDRLWVAAVRFQSMEEGQWGKVHLPDDDTIICRCERITKGEILRLIREGYRDLNQLKAALRVGMGACGGKTCEDLILKLFTDEGIDLTEVTRFTKRPPAIEVPLGVFAGLDR